MSSQDPFDQMIDEVFGCLVGAVLGLFGGILFGKWQHKQQEKWERERQIRFPPTLELPEETSEPHRALPRVFTGQYWYEAIMTLGAWSTGALAFGVGAMAIVSIAIDTTAASIIRGVLAFALAAAMGYGAVKLRGQNTQIKHKGKRDEATSQASHVAPLDLTRARLYIVRLPKTVEWHPQPAARFMEQILHKVQRLTFQIVAENGWVSWQILDLRRNLHPDVIKQAVHAFYPQADIEEKRVTWEEFRGPFFRYVMPFEQFSEPLFPIAYAEDLTRFDPLVNLSQELSDLRPGERVVYTVFVADLARFAYEQMERLLTVKPDFNPFQLLSPNGWADAGYNLSTQDQQRLAVFDPQDQQVVHTKVSNMLFQSLLFLQIDAATPERVKDLARIGSHVRQFSKFPYGLVVRYDETLAETTELVETPEQAYETSTLGCLNRWLTNESTNWRNFRMLLDTHELAALWHLPNKNFTGPAIEWARNRVQLPQQARGLRSGLCLGVNRFSGREEWVYILDEDRATHVNILGMTGVGKSTVMHHLITQDIHLGHGVALVDPHGKLVRDVLQTSIPEGREGDVVVLDLANLEYPPPLNPLAGTDSRASTARVISILEKIYGGWEDAPRMANALTSALMTLRSEPQATVRDVVRLFVDEVYRERLLGSVDDEVVEEFWRDEYGASTVGQQHQIREPVIYRMRSFYGIPDLYPIICHPKRLDFGKLMEEGKIILISLGMDEERIPERERNLVGAVVVSQLQMAAMKRSTESRPFYLYVDEVQNFVTTSLDKVFSEARKFGLSLTVANQYLQQLAGDTLDAMMGNVGAMIVFQCGLDDARRLAPYTLPGFAAEDLVNLDKYEAVVKMRVQGQTLSAFSLAPFLPRTVEALAPEERYQRLQAELRIRQLSQASYTPMSRDEVTAWLSERYPRRKKELGMADEGDFYEA